jgi:hypothetical protein
MACFDDFHMTSASELVDRAEGGESKNLVLNGSFEHGEEGWAVRGGGTLDILPVSNGAIEGRLSLSMKGEKLSIDQSGLPTTSVLDWQVYSQSYPIDPGASYRFSVWARHDVEYGDISASIDETMLDGTGVRRHSAFHETAPSSGEWRRYEMIFNTSLYSERLYVLLRSRRLVGHVWFDGVELEKIEPTPPPEIHGEAAVTFPGRPSDMGMTIEQVEQVGNTIVVTTTGAQYTFDTKSGIVHCAQRIGVERDVASVMFDDALVGLTTKRWDSDVCILESPSLTIGVQADSLVFVHFNRELNVRFSSNLIFPYFERRGGYVTAVDEWGGVCVMPSAHTGGGLAYRIAELEGDPQSGPWNLSLSMLRGYNVGFAVFPPRPYRRDMALTWRIGHTGGYPPHSAIDQWANFINVLTLHASFGSGGIYDGGTPWVGPYRLSEEAAARLAAIVERCHDNNIKVLPYAAPGMHSDLDKERFIDEIRRLKERFNFDGVFYDGTYEDEDWTKSYSLMRQTRSLFGPTGIIYLHTSNSPPLGNQRGGRIFCPFIDTYADILLTGESVLLDGLDDPYLRFRAAGYRVSNSVGMIKPNRAIGASAHHFDLRMIELGGTARWGLYPTDGVFPGQNRPPNDFYTTVLFPLLDQLLKEYKGFNQPEAVFERNILVPRVRQVMTTLPRDDQ